MRSDTTCKIPEELRACVDDLLKIGDARASAILYAIDCEEKARSQLPGDKHEYIDGSEFSRVYLDKAHRLVSEMIAVQHMLTVAGFAKWVPVALRLILQRTLRPLVPQPQQRITVGAG